MKTLSIIICIIALTFSGCKKCGTCTTTYTSTTYTNGVKTDTDVSTATCEACGDDLKAMNGNTSTAEATSGNFRVVTVAKTNCE